jgi:sugar phosphate permease
MVFENSFDTLSKSLRQSPNCMKRYYGWTILACIFCAYACASMAVTTFPLINVQLKQQFGWTHEQATLPPLLMYLFIGIFAPIAGVLLDRLQPKRLYIFGAIMLATALALYHTVDSVWMLSVVYFLAGAGTVCTGVLPGVYILSKWFKVKRGVAIGILLVGSSMGGVVFPQVASTMIRHSGWQAATLVLAVCALVIGVLPLIFLKNTPQEIGEEPDGLHTSSEEASTAPTAFTETAHGGAEFSTLGAIIRTPTFFAVLYVTASVWFCLTALTQHLGLYLKDLQCDIGTSANVTSVLLACSVIGKAMFGYLSDRFDKKTILLVASCSMMLGSVMMRLVAENKDLFLYPAAVVYGVGFSGCFTMIQLLVAEHYSRSAAYGRVLGVVTMLDTVAGALGIRILASLRTSTGDYKTGFVVLVVSGLLMIACVLVLRRPQERVRTIS